MNCLFLLLILCCCGQGNYANGCGNNRMWRNERSNDGCNHNHSVDRRIEECGCQEEKHEEDCGCSHALKHEDNHSHGVFIAPPASRTQYPYLDTEPRTCGCEENK